MGHELVPYQIPLTMSIPSWGAQHCGKRVDTDLKPLGSRLKSLFHSSKLRDPWGRASLVTRKEQGEKGCLGVSAGELAQRCPVPWDSYHHSNASPSGQRHQHPENLVSTAHSRHSGPTEPGTLGRGQQSVSPSPPCDLTARSTLRHMALSISLKNPH